MRVVFWGSPAFAVVTLEAVMASAHQVTGVVTQPPRAAGRGRRAAPTPVARTAAAAGVPVLAPDKPRGEPFLTALRSLRADLFLVAAYGEILPATVLATAPHGALNIHASLLPAYRGAAPVTRAILDGRRTTGITIMRMDAGLDTGPICLQAEEPIHPDDTAGSLTARLAGLGAPLAVEALERLTAGTLPEAPQDDAAASHAPKVDASEARLDWTRPAAELERAARAFDPWPGAWTIWRGERLKVFRLALEAGPEGLRADMGKLVAVQPGPLVQVGDGVVRLDVVQPPGGRRMAGSAWARGRSASVGERLGGDG